MSTSGEVPSFLTPGFSNVFQYRLSRSSGLFWFSSARPVLSIVLWSHLLVLKPKLYHSKSSTETSIHVCIRSCLGGWHMVTPTVWTRVTTFLNGWQGRAQLHTHRRVNTITCFRSFLFYFFIVNFISTSSYTQQTYFMFFIINLYLG